MARSRSALETPTAQYTPFAQHSGKFRTVSLGGGHENRSAGRCQHVAIENSAAANHGLFAQTHFQQMTAGEARRFTFGREHHLDVEGIAFANEWRKVSSDDHQGRVG